LFAWQLEHASFVENELHVTAVARDRQHFEAGSFSASEKEGHSFVLVAHSFLHDGFNASHWVFERNSSMWDGLGQRLYVVEIDPSRSKHENDEPRGFGKLDDLYGDHVVNHIAEVDSDRSRLEVKVQPVGHDGVKVVV